MDLGGGEVRTQEHAVEAGRGSEEGGSREKRGPALHRVTTGKEDREATPQKCFWGGTRGGWRS
jgi:hypothetical protein